MPSTSNNTLIHCREGDSSLVLSMPHSGTLLDARSPNFPSAARYQVNLEDPDVIRTVRASIDVAVPEMTGFRKRRADTLISTDLPRAITDVDCLGDHIDATSARSKSGFPPRHGWGLFWRSTLVQTNCTDSVAVGDAGDLGIKDMLKEPYAGVSITTLLDRTRDPYTREVTKAMERIVRDSRRKIAILLNLYTIPPYTAIRLEKGRHTGACVLGAQAKRGEVHSPEDLKTGKMPDVFLDAGFDANGNPTSCSPAIVKIIRDVFREAGLIVAEGNYSPWMSYGAQTQLANPAIGYHAMGIHQVGHDNLEPDRLQGSLKVNKRKARELQKIYTKIFDKLGGLTAKSLATKSI